MIKNEEEPHRAESAPVNSTPTCANSLVLEYVEIATKLFRRFLTEFLGEREREQGVSGSANWMAIVAEASLESVLQMIGEGGEFRATRQSSVDYCLGNAQKSLL